VIEGCGRFLDRLWRTATADQPTRTGPESEADHAIRQATHRTIAEVTDDIERWSYNTAVAHCMELLNALQRYGRDGEIPPHADVWNDGLDALCLVLAPLTPHLTAEIWERRHPGQPEVHLQPWPTFDPDLVRQATETMVVQVNGKVRDKLEVSPEVSEDELRELALVAPGVVRTLGEQQIRRVIVRAPKLVSIVAA
jgi:leucyl-tRNA synthetase